MKTNFLITIFFVLLLSTLISALSIEGANTVSMCQCETVRETYNVCASSTGAGNYFVTHSGVASNWVSIAPTQLTLANNECKSVHVFTTPECYANSGSYPITINVNGPESTSKVFNIIVEQCHTFDFSITPTNNSSRPCEPNEFNVYMKNTSKFTDKFVFNQVGLADSWISYNRQPFILQPNQELNTKIIVESACDATAGNYPFEFSVSNTQTNINAQRNLNQEIISFSPISHTIATNINVCSEENSERTFFIKNESVYDDEYSLTLIGAEFVSLSSNKLSINAGESKEVVLKMNTTFPREENLTLIISSQKYNRDFNIPIRVNSMNCYDHTIQRASVGTNYCIGNNSQEFVLTNTGTKESTITISTTGINMTPQEYVVAAQTSKTITLNFNEAQETTRNIVVKAESDYETRTVEFNMSFENCYGTNVDATALELCLGTTMQKTISVQNLGTQNQEYELSVNANWIELSENNVAINSGESKNVTLNMQVPSSVNESYLLTAKSDNATVSRTLPVQILSQEDCFGFEIKETLDVIDVNCCSGKIVELFITNTGHFEQEITLTKIAPPWVAFSEDTLTISPNTTQKTYVYFSPPVGTDGDYVAIINLKNNNGVEKNYEMNLNVFGGFCGIYLDAAIDVNNQISKTYVFIRKDVEVEFVVKNDSNVAFSILDMNTNEFDSKFEFERGVNLQPGESIKAKMVIGLGENPLPQQDTDVVVNVITSAGNFSQTQRINLSAVNEEGIPSYDLTITGLFTNFIAPAGGVLLLIIILILIVIVVTKAQVPKTKKK